MRKIYCLILILFVTVPLVNAQSIQEKQEVKNHFQNGNAPGAIHFGYLIDACYNYSVGEGLIYEPANNLLKSEVPLKLLEESLSDTAKTLRQERATEINFLKNSLSANETGFNEKIYDLENRMRTELLDTSSNIRFDINNSLTTLHTSLQSDFSTLSNKVNQNQNEITQSLTDSMVYLHSLIDEKSLNLEGKIGSLQSSVENDLIQFDVNKTNEISDTSANLRLEMKNLNEFANSKLNSEILKLDGKITKNHSEFKDASSKIRSDFELKLSKLENALKDSTNVLRKSISDLNDALILKIESGDNDVTLLLEKSKLTLTKKIDSLAEVHNLDRKIHEDRMTAIEENHSVLKDTVVKMKVKLDTLNYTEKNFTQTLKLKLDNIDDGATRSDNNFTDELKTKLEGVEQNANNYQLPLGTHGKLGGIQLSQDFVLYNGKAYNALDASKIDREYAKDTITKNWTSEMKTEDEWTRIRYKIENGLVDADGNKLYDYGEWNQPYKFIYDDLEASYYEYNATDSVNVILGIHEKNKKFLGEENTLLGHNAGYSLFKGGDRNIAIGKNAGSASENISDNVFIGYQAGESIGDPSKIAQIIGDDSSEKNLAIGNKAMQGRNSTGKSVALGYSAMELGEQNSTIAIGYKAAANNSGTNNIIVGYEAGLSVPGSNNNNNIAIGYRTAYKNTYAKRNVFVGDSAAFNNESGANNVFIGHGAGKTNTGNKNLFIGNDIDLVGDNQLAIGNNGTILLSGDFTSKLVSIDKLSTNELNVTTLKSDSYSITNKEVINNSAGFVGEGGVNSSGQIISSFSNTRTSSNRAISSPNGTVHAKYLSADESIQIGTGEVINNSAEFVGAGGVNTTGAITTSSSVNAAHFVSKTADFRDKLSAAGIEIIKTTGSVIEERYALKNHTHDISDINTSSTNQFVSQTEKNNWNNKVDKISGKGLSSKDFTSSYKSKLDGIAAGANKYVHPASHPASMISQDASHRFINDGERSDWNNKVDKVSGKDLSSNDFTNTYKSKLDGVASGANKYVHPSSHLASMVAEDATHRFVTDTEKSNWNNKADRSELPSNDYTDVEKEKLKGIAAGANRYVHPANHSADMITTSASKQFVSQSEKDNWTAGQIPVGGIIMWNGTTVPDGWALCNGQTINGQTTPDLRGRFIVGNYPGKVGFEAGNSGGSVGTTPTDISTNTTGSHNHSGNTGGYQLTSSDIPSHKHQFKNYYSVESTGLDDQRTGSNYGSEYIEKGIGSGDSDADNTQAFYKRMDTESSGSISPNTHMHSIASDGSHDHTVRVPYYVLAFIMRVK